MQQELTFTGTSTQCYNEILQTAIEIEEDPDNKVLPFYRLIRLVFRYIKEPDANERATVIATQNKIAGILRASPSVDKTIVGFDRMCTRYKVRTTGSEQSSERIKSILKSGTATPRNRDEDSKNTDNTETESKNE